MSVAGKTGTTELPNTPIYKGLSGNKDNWFCGYTPKYAAAFWLGYDEKDMSRQNYLRTYGGDIPAELFSLIISKAGGPVNLRNTDAFNSEDINQKEAAKAAEGVDHSQNINDHLLH